MPSERILPQQYMHLTKELREHITAVFHVKRTGVSEVRDQDIISDGTSYDDLIVITKQAMCEYIGSEETFARAWELTIAKAYSELHPPIGEIKRSEPAEEEIVAPEPVVVDEVISKPLHAKKEKVK